MGISRGTQLIAPCGFRQLEKGVTYYFVWSDAGRERVHLIRFIQRMPKKRQKPDKTGRFLVETPTPLVVHVVMRRAHFERGTKTGEICAADQQQRLPPWLAPLENVNFDAFDLMRSGAAKSHKQRMMDKIESIYPLIRTYQEVLATEDPDRALNKFARSCTPAINESRFRIYFFCYLLFGDKGLFYPIHKMGRWDRSFDQGGAKRGRPNINKGKGHGYNMFKEEHVRIVASYIKYRGLGITMTTIYANAMTADFGCRERSDAHGMLFYFHPNGDPFPTFGQFYSHVTQEFGLKAIQETRLGPNQVRNLLTGSVGTYTQKVANLMEHVESDGYTCQGRPAGFIEDVTLPSLYVIRKRDLASGLITGIGFSFGGESAAAYRMATFCEAIDKVRFMRLFGIPITKEQWSSQGVAPNSIADRGPGCTDGAFTEDPEFRPAIREMPAAFTPQSKALIESSNPKNQKNRESPSYFREGKNVFQMALKELTRALKDNDSIDITARIPPELWAEIRKPCPNVLWSALDGRGRNDAILMSFDDAVRAYLDKVDATVDIDGVYLHGQRYHSIALEKSGLLDKVAVSQTMKAQVYLLSACVRHIWMEIDGVLIELDLQVGLRIGNETLYMPLKILRDRELDVRAIGRDFSEHRLATVSKLNREHEEVTGSRWDTTKRVAGRAKVGSAASRQAVRETKAMMSGKKTS